MEARPEFYIRKTIEVMSIMCMSFVLQYYGWYLTSACFLALGWQQLGWLTHEYCHHQPLKNRRINDYWSLFLGNVAQGFSRNWWKLKHNTHHAATNIIGRTYMSLWCSRFKTRTGILTWPRSSPWFPTIWRDIKSRWSNSCSSSSPTSICTTPSSCRSWDSRGVRKASSMSSALPLASIKKIEPMPWASKYEHFTDVLNRLDRHPSPLVVGPLATVLAPVELASNRLLLDQSTRRRLSSGARRHVQSQFCR